MKSKWLALVAGVATLGLAGHALAANTLSATYFVVSESDPDFQHNGCCSEYYTNEVTSTLGPDGLPVYNAGFGGTTLNDVNGAGELTWWSPGFNSNVTQTGAGVVVVPYNDSNMYPPNGTGSNDANGFETAIFRGVLHVATTGDVTFNMGSDDDSFLALNNTVIDQAGGIHPVWNPGPVTLDLTAGNYDLTLFYADRYQTDAVLDFGVTGATVSAVPEPGTWALMLVGFGALGSGLRAARRRTALAA
jgi:hypothetical protein